MNTLSIWTLKALRKAYATILVPHQLTQPNCENDAQNASQIIFSTLIDESPCMIARFGAFELSCLVNYLGVQKKDRNIFKFIRGETLQWWWNEKILFHMQNNAGFFPASKKNIERFYELMVKDIEELDVLGSWLTGENYLHDKLESVSKVKLVLLEPYVSTTPWSRCLKGKRVLVVHPFAELIERQYRNREFLFNNSEVLPKFNLQTIKAVQSLGGKRHGFKDWFEALQWMKDEIDKCDYDVCLIGCGAYGFPLAAHVKRQGKKSVHLGGALQLLFGIKGKRWENPKYHDSWGLPHNFYLDLMDNNYWVRPSDNLKPLNAHKVEGAAYW